MNGKKAKAIRQVAQAASISKPERNYMAQVHKPIMVQKPTDLKPSPRYRVTFKLGDSTRATYQVLKKVTKNA